MNYTKSVFRIFTADNYDKEEEFLREMSLEGWHFRALNLFWYEFEKGEPREYNYKLDFKPRYNEIDSEYLTMFKDFGWERIYEFRAFRGVWEYFRKEADGAENELYTDDESKIELLGRIRRFYLFLGIFFVSISLVNAVNIARLFVEGAEYALIGVSAYAFLIGLYVKLYVRISAKIKRLKKGI